MARFVDRENARVRDWTEVFPVPRNLIRLITLIILTSQWFAVSLFAQVKSADHLVPATTKGFMIVPDVQKIQQAWDRIPLGKMAADPQVKAFVEDLQAQIQSRLDRTGTRIGLSIDDFVNVCASEVAVAFIQPEEGPQKHAVAAIADIHGKEDGVKKLLQQVEKTMNERNAEHEVRTVLGVRMDVYTIPIKEGTRKTFQAVLFEAEDRLVAVDHEGIAVQILKIIKGGEGNVLATHQPYVKTMNRCFRESDGVRPHMMWFVDPIGYAEIARDAAGIERKNSEYVQALADQGFSAVQGIGGYLTLDVGDFELLHRSYVYAPPVEGAGAEKYELGARILAFPGSDVLDIQPWVPETINSYVTGTWEIQESYKYIDTLVDAMVGGEGVFEDVKASFREDPTGPQVDLDDEIVAHLGTRVTLITDCQLPIGPSSERFVAAISLEDADAMAAGIKKVFETDPAAKAVDVDGHVVWEIINEDADAPIVEVEGGDDFSSFAEYETEESDDSDEEMMPPLMTSAAISVVEGQLMISSHLEFISEIIRRSQNAKTIAESDDYKKVMNALQTLGSTDKDTIRLFSRTDQEFQTTYELIREGRMPESEGLLGSLLNRILAPKEKNVVRSQQIDGSKMPEYDVARPYLGPVGLYVQSEDEGWYGVAVGLAKDAPANPTGDAAVSTAERP